MFWKNNFGSKKKRFEFNLNGFDDNYNHEQTNMDKFGKIILTTFFPSWSIWRDEIINEKKRDA